MQRISLAVAVLLSLSGCSTNPGEPIALSGECDGIRVVVDFDILSPENIDSCVSIEGEGIKAAELLALAGVTTQGTAAYGDAVVCRVNDLPSSTQAFSVPGGEAYVESCQDMPPGFAYWALWTITDSELGWDYATEGIGTLELKKGQSIGLIFSTSGETPNPDRT